MTSSLLRLPFDALPPPESRATSWLVLAVVLLGVLAIGVWLVRRMRRR